MLRTALHSDPGSVSSIDFNLTQWNEMYCFLNLNIYIIYTHKQNISHTFSLICPLSLSHTDKCEQTLGPSGWVNRARCCTLERWINPTGAHFTLWFHIRNRLDKMARLCQLAFTAGLLLELYGLAAEVREQDPGTRQRSRCWEARRLVVMW